MMLLIFITLVCCIEFVVYALQLHKKNGVWDDRACEF